MREDLHSRVIGLLKLLLPLAGLGLLSTVFLLARSQERGAVLPLAQADLASRAAREQITAPYFAGATEAGDLVAMTALRAMPDGKVPGRARAEGVWTRIDLVDGTTLTFSADRALIDEPADRAAFDGNVRVDSSNGWHVRTAGLTSRIRSIEAESTGPVEGRSPAGTIEAGRLEIRPAGTGGQVRLLFTRGVKLVYGPDGIDPGEDAPQP